MNVENVELKELKDAVKALNEADILETKIKVIGVSKEKLAADLTDIVSQMVENSIEIPEGVMDVYNVLTAEAAEEEAVEAAPAKPKIGAKKAATAAPAPAPAAKAEKAPKAEKAEKAPKEKKTGAPNKGPMSRPKDFADVKARLENPTNPTQAFDSLCLTGGSPKELIGQFAEIVKESFPDFGGFKTETSINSHIGYREEHGWKYEKKGDKIKLVGFTA
jgi:hypothetical protein